MNKKSVDRLLDMLLTGKKRNESIKEELTDQLRKTTLPEAREYTSKMIGYHEGLESAYEITYMSILNILEMEGEGGE